MVIKRTSVRFRGRGGGEEEFNEEINSLYLPQSAVA
jgi:hypothetical protein